MSKLTHLNLLLTIAMTTLGAAATWSTIQETATQESTTAATDDASAIRKVVSSAYFNGAFNEQNTEDMAKGFHEDFAIFSAKGEKLARYEIEVWIEGIKKRRASSDFDPKSTVFEGKIVNLDVTGGAASAKIEFHKDDKIVYTDYISLLKFDSGWKIAAKVYHRHK